MGRREGVRGSHCGCGSKTEIKPELSELDQLSRAWVNNVVTYFQRGVRKWTIRGIWQNHRYLHRGINSQLLVGMVLLTDSTVDLRFGGKVCFELNMSIFSCP